MFKLIWSAILGGNPTSWAILGLGAVLALGGTFGTGWYLGSTHEATIMANAATTAADRARSDQAKQDALDFKNAKADADKRHQEDEDRNKHLTDLLAIKNKIPNPTKCAVPQDFMKSLNDPALVGETQ